MKLIVIITGTHYSVFQCMICVCYGTIGPHNSAQNNIHILSDVPIVVIRSKQLMVVCFFFLFFLLSNRFSLKHSKNNSRLPSDFKNTTTDGRVLSSARGHSSAKFTRSSMDDGLCPISQNEMQFESAPYMYNIIIGLIYHCQRV